MCGRYAIYAPPQKLKDLFGTENIIDFLPRYNAAPQQELPVIIRNRMGLARWGWSENNFFNARSETVAEKTSFSESWARRRRCLIPANGFYEWAAKAGGKKQPYFIRNPGLEVFAFAGLWTKLPDQSITYTILTKQADGEIKNLHERMPVMLASDQTATWFDADESGARNLIAQATAAPMTFHPVGPGVGKVANDSEMLIEKQAMLI